MGVHVFLLIKKLGKGCVGIVPRKKPAESLTHRVQWRNEHTVQGEKMKVCAQSLCLCVRACVCVCVWMGVCVCVCMCV